MALGRSVRSSASRPPPGTRRWMAVSGAEVHDRRSATDALDPDVLEPLDVAGDVTRRDDHLRAERLVVGVARAVEVRLEDDGISQRGRGLRGLARGTRALERRVRQEARCVPPDTLSLQAAGEEALTDVVRAAEAASGVNGAGRRAEAEGAPARQSDAAGGEAGDVWGVEAETDRGTCGKRRRRSKRSNQQDGRGRQEVEPPDGPTTQRSHPIHLHPPTSFLGYVPWIDRSIHG